MVISLRNPRWSVDGSAAPGQRVGLGETVQLVPVDEVREKALSLLLVSKVGHESEVILGEP